MAKADAVTVAPKLYKLLAPLSSDERAKAIQATLILFGEQTVSTGGGTKLNNADPPKASMTFFEDKKPANKGEILAVAARYREIYEKADTHSKEEIKKVIADARRNFDSHNYMRDMKNAKRQAGFFNLGTKGDANQLSYYGQQYVDALPDREAAGKLHRPKARRGKTKKGNRDKP